MGEAVFFEKKWHSRGFSWERLCTIPMSPEPPSRTEQLVLLLTQNQEPLFRYIFSLVSSEADARDILQETSLALYRKFHQYEESRPFLPWAYRFAYLQIQKHRAQSARSPLLFSEGLIHLLAVEREQIEPQLDQRLQFLDGCLSKLTSQDKELVTSRYALRESADEMMQRFAMSRRTLFRNLELLRQRLHDCVSRQIQSKATT